MACRNLLATNQGDLNPAWRRGLASRHGSGSRSGRARHDGTTITDPWGRETLRSRLNRRWRTRARRLLTHPERLRPGFAPTSRPPGPRQGPHGASGRAAPAQLSTAPSLPRTRADRATWTKPVRWSGRGPNRPPWPAWAKPAPSVRRGPSRFVGPARRGPRRSPGPAPPGPSRQLVRDGWTNPPDQRRPIPRVMAAHGPDMRRRRKPTGHGRC
jgi:hypothetical protein